MTSPKASFRRLPLSLLATLVASVAIATPAASEHRPGFEEASQPTITATKSLDLDVISEESTAQAPTSSVVTHLTSEQTPETQLPHAEIHQAEAPEEVEILEEQTEQPASLPDQALPKVTEDTLPEATMPEVVNDESSDSKTDETSEANSQETKAQEPKTQESEASSEEQEPETARILTPEELARQQMLIEADALLAAGDTEAAEALYRQAKDPFSEEAEAAPRADAFSDPEQLSPGGKVYWRESAAGLEQNLQTRALVPAKLMTERHPEFVPGHLRYAEALRKYDQLGDGLAVMERAAARYPSQPELQQGLIDFQVETKRWLEASITARQFALLNPEHPQAEEFKALAEKYQAHHRKVLRQTITTNAIAGGLTTALNVALTGNPFNAIPGIQSSVLLLRGEDSVGNSAAKRAKKRYDMIEDPEVQTYVDNIGQKLVAVTGREMDYEFNIIKDEKLNAFALPGGKIFINAGAITKSNSEAELAGLIAHELAHAVLSHGFQLVTDGTATTGLTSLLPFGSLFSRLALTDYSRDMEEQADLLGTRMLSSAGYSADGLRNLMVTLSEEKQEGLKPPVWLSTHPRNKTRVSYLEKLIETNGYNRYTYEGVAEHLRIRERVQAILDTPEEEDSKKLDDEIQDLKDQKASDEKPTEANSDQPSNTEQAP